MQRLCHMPKQCQQHSSYSKQPPSGSKVSQPTPAMAAAGTKLSQEVIDKVNAIMDASTPVNHKVDQLVKCFLQYGLARSQTLLPGDILVHPANRASLVLNHHDVWSKGVSMIQVGMKRQLLGEAMAFEMSMDTTKKDEQVQKNHDMVGRSMGCLAPVLGQERALTCFFLVGMVQTVKIHYLLPLCPLRIPVHFLLPHHSLFEGHSAWLPRAQ